MKDCAPLNNFKYEACSCPEQRMSAIGKFPRNCIGHIQNVRISLRLKSSTIFLSLKVQYLFSQKVQPVLNFGCGDVGVLQSVQRLPQPLQHLLHQQHHEVWTENICNVHICLSLMARLMWVEAFYIVFSIFLSLTDLPTLSEVPHRVVSIVPAHFSQPLVPGPLLCNKAKKAWAKKIPIWVCAGKYLQGVAWEKWPAEVC